LKNLFISLTFLKTRKDCNNILVQVFVYLKPNFLDLLSELRLLSLVQSIRHGNKTCMAICGSTRNAMKNLAYPRKNTRGKNRLRKWELKKPLTPVRIRPVDCCSPLLSLWILASFITNVASLGTFYISIKMVNIISPLSRIYVRN